MNFVQIRKGSFQNRYLCTAVFYSNLTSFLNETPEQPFLMLIGNPVKHSFSPLIHNEALKRIGLDWRYVAVAVQPEEFSRLTEVFQHPLFRGANVTIPYKIDIMPLLHSVDERAQKIGAVNTLAVEKVGVRGYNSDNAGFLDGLKQAGVKNVSKAIILGTGGTSKMVVKALEGLGCGANLVFSRNPEPGEFGYSVLRSKMEGADLLVNCTPVGMWPNVGVSPVPVEFFSQMKSGAVYDLIYRPYKTQLLLNAAKADCRIIPGLEMFVGQAARSFERWTGKLFPREDIKSILIKTLHEST